MLNISLVLYRFADPFSAITANSNWTAGATARTVAIYVAILGENASPDAHKQLSQVNKQSDALFKNSLAEPEPYACNMKHVCNYYIMT
jgi:hypothetical protein